MFSPQMPMPRTHGKWCSINGTPNLNIGYTTYLNAPGKLHNILLKNRCVLGLEFQILVMLEILSSCFYSISVAPVTPCPKKILITEMMKKQSNGLTIQFITTQFIFFTNSATMLLDMFKVSLKYFLGPIHKAGCFGFGFKHTHAHKTQFTKK